VLLSRICWVRRLRKTLKAPLGQDELIVWVFPSGSKPYAPLPWRGERFANRAVLGEDGSHRLTPLADIALFIAAYMESRKFSGRRDKSLLRTARVSRTFLKKGVGRRIHGLRGAVISVRIRRAAWEVHNDDSTSPLSSGEGQRVLFIDIDLQATRATVWAQTSSR
jgi:hypothetical protein